MSTPTVLQTPSAAFLPPPPAYEYAYRYAPLGTRFAAAILDLILLLAVAAVIAIPFGILVAMTTLAFGTAAWVSGIFFGPLLLVLVLLWLLYFTYFEGTSGQTPGKRALGIRVVVLGTGRPPTLERAFIRSILRLVDWLPFLYFVGFVVAALTARKQRLGDLLADTVVVQA